MDPAPISAYKLGRIYRKDEQWVAQLEKMMTPEDKLQLQDILHGTHNMYGGTKAPSSTRLYEFEDSIFDRHLKQEEEHARNQTQIIAQLTHQVAELYAIIKDMKK